MIYTAISILWPITVLEAQKPDNGGPWGMETRMGHSTKHPVTKNSKGESKISVEEAVIRSTLEDDTGQLERY